MGGCCGCFTSPWYPPPAVPPAPAAPHALAHGHCWGQGGWHEPAGGSCSLDSPSSIPPFPKVWQSCVQTMACSYWGFGVSNAPFQRALFCLAQCFEDLSPDLVKAGSWESPLKVILELFGCLPQLIALEGLWSAP